MNEYMSNQPEKKKTNKPWRGAVNTGVVLAALAGGYILRGTTSDAQPGSGTMPPVDRTPVVETPATKGAATMQNAFSEVANAVEPAVVTITTTRRARPTAARNPGGGAMPEGGGGGQGGDPFEEFFRRFRDYGFSPNSAEKKEMRKYFYKIQEGRGGGGIGSGMIYRQDGYILTNAHVVQDADTVAVKLFDGRTFKNAKVLGSDERTDVAVVKIEAEKLPIVKFGISNDVRVGDWAIAIGNPFDLTSTLTVGVISAKAREVNLNVRSPGDYLQTDASINPGNSGGPLCDIYGRVIGVNNAIYSQSGGNIGIGFAIPIDTARGIADRLVKNGKITRSYLGVKIKSVEELGAAYGLDPNTKGVLIEEISDPEGPAAKAGVQPGDVIVEFNGKPITRSAELQRMVGDAPVGSTATMKILREGKGLTISAKLTELKEEDGPSPRRIPNRGGEDETNGTSVGLGLRLRPLTPELAQRFGLKETKGLVVQAVDPNSPAANAGVRPGDLIERVGQTPVTSSAEVQAAVKSLLDKQTGDDKLVGLYVNRKGQKQYVVVEVTPQP